MSAPSLPELAARLSRYDGQPVAFDFETNGLDPTAADAEIRSIGLCNGSGGALAIDLLGMGREARAHLFEWLCQQELIAFNYVFDGAWLRAETGNIVAPRACMYALFKHLATEGYAGQSWSLKTAMTDILGWPEQNTTDLDAWLKEHKLGKGDMSKAPFDILGPYNGLDAAATWQLFGYFARVAGQFPHLISYTQQEVRNEICLLIEQQFSGLTIDVKQLELRGRQLEQDMAGLMTQFYGHPDVAAAVAQYNQAVVASVAAAEPPKHKKNGEVTKRWQNWHGKLMEAELKNHYNPDSPKQLAWLFYDVLKYPVQRRTPTGEPSVDVKSLPSLGVPGKILGRYRKLRDVRKFVSATMNVQRDGTMYPSMKMPATVTGRLGGGRLDG